MYCSPGSIIKCSGSKTYKCAEKVRIIEPFDGDVYRYKCAKCDLGKTWICPDPRSIVPAGCYTSCVMCNSQVLCKKDYLGSKPKCHACRVEKPKVCVDCGKPNLKDKYFAPSPYAEEIHNDTTPMWICYDCRCDSAWEI